MPFDGNFTAKVSNELSAAIDARIDKIYQPSGDEIILTLRKKDFAKRLIISVGSGVARVHFTETRPENPEKPPMFCMLFRKLFSGAKLLKVMQSGFERLIEFVFETTNEMGDKVSRKIIVELIGNLSNIVLVDEKGKIIDALRRSDILSQKRLIQPGAIYNYPPSQTKIDIKTEETDLVIERIINDYSDLSLSKALLSTLGGISPLVVRELIFRTGLSDDTVKDIKDFTLIKQQLKFYKTALTGASIPFMLLKDSIPVDFSYIKIGQYGDLYKTKTFATYSELLDAFYFEKAKGIEQGRITGEVNKLVTTLISRANKRLQNRITELENSQNREDLRIKGELIKANISKIKPGSDFVTVKNFYDENLSDLTIKLDKSLNPQNNAAKYFKEYKKRTVAAATLKDLIKLDKDEIEYLETVMDNLSRCRTTGDLREIKEELKLSGYIKNKKNEKPNRKNTSNFDEYKSIEGFRIVVGKNNLQNDLLTVKMASKNDYWFHTKNIHGAHVVVFCGGEEISRETVIFAAKLAAKNSKAANSSNVPVDYTRIKNVKKPSGAKPGMVIYKENQTVYVTP